MKKNRILKLRVVFAVLVLTLAWGCRSLRETPPDTDPEYFKSDNLIEEGKCDTAKKVEISQGKEFVCKTIDVRFVHIPAGEFIMGNNNSFSDEKPEHKVKISKDFWVAVIETTQEQYEKLTGHNPSFNNRGGRYPVEQVSWEDAVKFCKMLTDKERENIPAGYEYRLPTEAEWEYMCRLGKIEMENIDEYAWHSGNSENETQMTGLKKADANGIFDIIGNVWEWCLDSCELDEDGVITKETYKGEYATDPISKTGKFKVHRGGSWCFDRQQCTPTRRYGNEKDFTSGDLGFRIILGPKIEIE